MDLRVPQPCLFPTPTPTQQQPTLPTSNLRQSPVNPVKTTQITPVKPLVSSTFSPTAGTATNVTSVALTKSSTTSPATQVVWGYIWPCFMVATFSLLHQFL